MPPMAEYELTFSYMLGGITRGILVGCFVGLFIIFVVDFRLFNIFIIIYFGLFSSSLLSIFGILCGVLGKKFDHMAAVTKFRNRSINFFIWYILHN